MSTFFVPKILFIEKKFKGWNVLNQDKHFRRLQQSVLSKKNNRLFRRMLDASYKNRREKGMSEYFLALLVYIFHKDVLNKNV